MGKNCKLQKKIMQVFITLLVGELTLQWINPGHQRVPLLIGSSKILFHRHTQVGFWVTDICLRCGDERIYNNFSSMNLPSFQITEKYFWQKLYLGGCTNSWRIQ